MASLRDRVLLQLSDPDQLRAAVLPAGDTVGQRVRTMLAAAYDLSAVRLDQIGGVTVGDVSKLGREAFGRLTAEGRIHLR